MHTMTYNDIYNERPVTQDRNNQV